MVVVGADGVNHLRRHVVETLKHVRIAPCQLGDAHVRRGGVGNSQPGLVVGAKVDFQSVASAPGKLTQRSTGPLGRPPLQKLHNEQPERTDGGKGDEKALDAP